MKVAIIGCGGMGNVHAAAYAKIPGVDIVGVCDIVPELAEALAGKTGATVYASFEDMLAQSECEAVSITLPSHLHKDYSIQAAKAGKHVICEKPIALQLEDAAEMIRVCEANNVRLFVGHVVRFFPEYARIRKAVTENKLGRLGVVHTKRIGSHPGDVRPWFKEMDKSGGVVIDLMIHDLDYLSWTLGEVRSVYGLLKADHSQEYALATLVFASGAVANVEAHWGFPGPFTTSIELAGSNGVIRTDNQRTVSNRLFKSASSSEGRSFVEVPQSSSYRSPYQIQLQHFIDCIRENRQSLVTPQDACRALEIALAVLESVRTGEVVLLNSGAEEGLQ